MHTELPFHSDHRHRECGLTLECEISNANGLKCDGRLIFNALTRKLYAKTDLHRVSIWLVY